MRHFYQYLHFMSSCIFFSRPDNETGWVLNRFEKCVPVYNKMEVVESSPKKSPISKKVPSNNKKKSSLAEVLMAIDGKKEFKKGRGFKSRSSTASPATVNGGASAMEILDLDELEQKKVIKHNSLDDEEDDSELRVKATIAKVNIRFLARKFKHSIWRIFSIF